MKFKTLFYLILLTLFASLIPAVHAQTFSVIHSFTYWARRLFSSCGSDDTRERTLWNDIWRVLYAAVPCIN